MLSLIKMTSMNELIDPFIVVRHTGPEESSSAAIEGASEPTSGVANKDAIDHQVAWSSSPSDV